MKAPKQWKHWCRTARLKQHGRGRGDWAWRYLRGHGRYWRLNCFDQFECGDTYVEFDRWALCDIKRVPMPTTRDEFLRAVRYLLELHNVRKAMIANTITVSRVLIDGKELYEATIEGFPDMTSYGDTHQEAYDLAVDAMETYAAILAENNIQRAKFFATPGDKS